MKKIKLDGNWINALQKIQTIDSSAIIAGGAIRDTYLGLPVNDVDIYTTAKLSSERWKEVLELNDNSILYNAADTATHDDSLDIFAPAPIKAASGDGCEFIRNVFNVIDSTCPTAPQLQIIQLKKLEPIHYVMNHFDIGLCKVYCDGVKIHYSADFIKDVTNNTLTVDADVLLQSQSKTWRTLNGHIQKMSERFPERTVILDYL